MRGHTLFNKTKNQSVNTVYLDGVNFEIYVLNSGKSIITCKKKYGFQN